MIRTIILFLSVTYSFAQQGNPGCLLKAVNGNPRMFQVNAPMARNRQFYCPSNTLFDPKQCGCGWVDNPVNPSPNQAGFGMGNGNMNNMGGGMGNMGGGMGNMGGGMGNMGGGMGNMGGGGQGGMVDTAIMTTPLPTTRPPCEFRANPDKHIYEQFIVGFDWIMRRCPMGTLFNQESCACHEIDPNQKYTCHPELWINFNGREIEDSAGYQISVGNNGNVVNVSNAGRFDGTGTLTVWQYANQDLGTGLTINLRFYEFPGGVSDEQVLISNCYDRRLGSIELALNTKDKMVIFRVEARIGRYPEGVELMLPYREKAWKNVTLAYDGNQVMAKVDDEFQVAPLKGHVTRRYNGLLIGSCNGRGYVGYIDDLRLYRCLLDQNQNGGFQNSGAANNMAMGMDPMMSAGRSMGNNGGPMVNGGGSMTNNGGSMMNNGGPMMGRGAQRGNTGGSMGNGAGSMMNDGGSMMNNVGGSMGTGGGSMMNNGGGMGTGGGSMMNDGGAMGTGGGSMMNDGGSMMNNVGGSMMNNGGGSMGTGGGSMMNDGGSMMNNGGGSMGTGGGSMMNDGGSMMNNVGGSMMNNGGAMMNNGGSMGTGGGSMMNNGGGSMGTGGGVMMDAGGTLF